MCRGGGAGHWRGGPHRLFRCPQESHQTGAEDGTDRTKTERPDSGHCCPGQGRAGTYNTTGTRHLHVTHI